MEHSTCTLDISSDEESAARMKDERGKENVPPPDDVSQTRIQLNSVDSTEASMIDIKARIKASRKKHENAIDIDRSPLGDLLAEDFYAEGCDGSSVFLIPSDETPQDEQVEAPVAFEVAPTSEDIGKRKEIDIEALMARDVDTIAPKAALLEPIEKAEEGFELWESSSAKGDE